MENNQTFFVRFVYTKFFFTVLFYLVTFEIDSFCIVIGSLITVCSMTT